MRYLLVALILLSSQADGAVRRLSECGTQSGTPSEPNPFDLDRCTLRDGDDITELLKDVAAKYGAIHVRAPSKSLAVFADTTLWATAVSGKPIKTFVFLEHQDPANKLTITHIPSNPEGLVALAPIALDTKGKHVLWGFRNAAYVKVGGPNLSITFIGTHPGLSTGDNTQAGLLEFVTDDGSIPSLADLRANFKNTHSHGILFMGGSGGSDLESEWNRYAQVKIAGTFFSSGFFAMDGVHEIWIDPDRTRVMDPFNRTNGWDGTATALSGKSYKVGCSNLKNAEYRDNASASAMFVKRISGGVTFEYGTPNGNIFAAKYIGNGLADPYKIQYKDFGFSGPTELTGLPPGVLVKNSISVQMMKHDPLPEFGFTGPTFRFLRFKQLPSTYGNGIYSGGLSTCSTNSGPTGYPNIWLAEASRDAVAARYVTAWVDVTVDGLTNWEPYGDEYTYFSPLGSGTDSGPQGPVTPDRTFGHVLRATEGTRVPGKVAMLDTNTLTGPGSWNRPTIIPFTTAQGATLNPIDNRFLDTHIHGYIEIGSNATHTTATNVDFRGEAARTIITIGPGSDIALTDVCVRPGSSITGTGVVTLTGVGKLTLPYTFTVGRADCNIIKDVKPMPPQSVTVF